MQSKGSSAAKQFVLLHKMIPDARSNYSFSEEAYISIIDSDYNCSASHGVKITREITRLNYFLLQREILGKMRYLCGILSLRLGTLSGRAFEIIQSCIFDALQC